MSATPSSSPDDVRMRGFRNRTPVNLALSWLDTALDEWLAARTQQPDSTELLPLQECCNRVLAEDLVSGIPVPRFERAMMDGYAVHSEDLMAVSADHSVELRVVGESLPGRPFTETLLQGSAIRIMTGAPFPAGADAVLPVELTRPLTDGRVLAIAKIPAGRHVGRVAEDIRPGERLLPAGRRLRPQDIAAASSIGCPRLLVFRRPRVRILITGSELLPAGSVPQGFRITDSNGPLLQALALRDAGVLPPLEYTGDDPGRLLKAFREPADVFLVSGASSVGQEDFAPGVLAQVGELSIHGLALRPAAPTGLGRCASAFVFLIPGNPVSCLCAGDLFAGRALRRMLGGSGRWPYASQMLELGATVASAAGRRDYVRVRREGRQVFPVASGGAAMLGATVRADGFIWIPEELEQAVAGASVEFFSYDP
ncbi:MAG: molybdopterin molybdotransferase MoeA [Planctomycetota bacterium]